MFAARVVPTVPCVNTTVWINEEKKSRGERTRRREKKQEIEDWRREVEDERREAGDGFGFRRDDQGESPRSTGVRECVGGVRQGREADWSSR